MDNCLMCWQERAGCASPFQERPDMKICASCRKTVGAVLGWLKYQGATFDLSKPATDSPVDKKK